MKRGTGSYETLGEEYFRKKKEQYKGPEVDMSFVGLKSGSETRVVGDDVRETCRSQITRALVLTEKISHWRVLTERMK